MASNRLPDKKLTEVKNISIDDTSTAPLCSLCFVDSVIYNIVMHVVIVGTVVPLFFHLRKNNYYFSTVSALIAAEILSFVFQLACVNDWPEALVYGSLSHVFGVTSIFLLLRLISPVLAMRTCIPILVWFGITFIYHVGSCCCAAIQSDFERNLKARRDAQSDFERNLKARRDAQRDFERNLKARRDAANLV
ncbi:unnamed protein product [Eruca vesicaria subsp. sativa]|uniref:Uncharacterized protein n=1 Tax=Eruca vesicaria subsp. sativa TaxID=29727 RepID=A0ABC8KPC1_ERUVS|nr:unnamed protein product [Eruca vesicaria subsp. sativa]